MEKFFKMLWGNEDFWIALAVVTVGMLFFWEDWL